MIGVMIVPTGLGCSIGGHAGDANAAAKLMAACCDELIVHPNVVNASDINEMPANCLYVDGYSLDQFLAGKTSLRRRTFGSNRVLVLCNKPATVETINAVNAARATIGLDAEILELDTPLYLEAGLTDTGAATGFYRGVDELVHQVRNEDFDALAISTSVYTDKEVAFDYLRRGDGVNPWGYIEALTSRAISSRVGTPVAHAPIDCVITEWDEVVDPRLAAEVVSVAYLHCVLKGLHRAPANVSYDHPASRVLSTDLAWAHVDVLISPMGCWGNPHQFCRQRGIPILWVRENRPAKPVVTPYEDGKDYIANTYLDAAGYLMAMRAGVSAESVRRPLRSIQ